MHMITQVIIEPTHTDDINADRGTVEKALSYLDKVSVYPVPPYGDVLLVDVSDSEDAQAYVMRRLERIGFLAIVWDRQEWDDMLT
jgi:hypothetical protein